MTEQNSELSELLQLTADIVASHVSNNSVAVNELPQLVQQVYDSLSGLGKAPEAAQQERPTPAVPVRKSVTPDYIVCLEDGKKLKMELAAGLSDGGAALRRTASGPCQEDRPGHGPSAQPRLKGWHRPGKQSAPLETVLRRALPAIRTRCSGGLNGSAMKKAFA